MLKTSRFLLKWNVTTNNNSAVAATGEDDITNDIKFTYLYNTEWSFVTS